MTIQKPKTPERDIRKPVKPVPPTPAPAPLTVPPLFRKIDWLAMAITFGVVGLVWVDGYRVLIRHFAG